MTPIKILFFNYCRSSLNSHVAKNKRVFVWVPEPVVNAKETNTVLDRPSGHRAHVSAEVPIVSSHYLHVDEQCNSCEREN